MPLPFYPTAWDFMLSSLVIRDCGSSQMLLYTFSILHSIFPGIPSTPQRKQTSDNWDFHCILSLLKEEDYHLHTRMRAIVSLSLLLEHQLHQGVHFPLCP